MYPVIMGAPAPRFEACLQRLLTGLFYLVLVFDALTTLLMAFPWSLLLGGKGSFCTTSSRPKCGIPCKPGVLLSSSIFI